MTNLVTYTCGTCGMTRELKWRAGTVNLSKNCSVCAGKKNRPPGTWGTHHGYRTPIYNVWCGMKQRCHWTKGKHYKDYGGRGITVCSEWLSDFPAFKAWAEKSGYAKGLIIDRIDVNGNYEPANCQWVNTFWNATNKRNSVLSPNDAYVIKDLTRRGVRPSLVAALYGLTNSAVSQIKYGQAWGNVERELGMPTL